MKLKIEREWHYNKVSCEYDVYYDYNNRCWVNETESALEAVKQALELADSKFNADVQEKPKKAPKAKIEPKKPIVEVKDYMVTEKQKALLNRLYPGYEFDYDNMDSMQASQLIDEYYKRK